MWAEANIGSAPLCRIITGQQRQAQPKTHHYRREMHYSARPTSVIAQQMLRAPYAPPQDMAATQTGPVITLDLWFNTLWQHWELVNEIAFFICISVFRNKSNPRHACCTVWMMWSQIKSNCPAVTHQIHDRISALIQILLDSELVPQAQVSSFKIRDSCTMLSRVDGDHIAPVSHRWGEVRKSTAVNPLVKLWCYKRLKSWIKRPLLHK